MNRVIIQVKDLYGISDTKETILVLRNVTLGLDHF